MSGSGRNERAFPANDLDRDWTFFTDVGGKGGSPGCPDLLGVDRNVIAFENNPFMVYNKLSILQISLSTISLVHVDAGPSSGLFGDCDHSRGDRVPIHIAFSSNPDLSVAEIMEQNNQLPADWVPDDGPLQFTYRDRNPDGSLGFIPQPTDPAYDGHSYLTLYWGDPSYVAIIKGTTGLLPGDSATLDITSIIKEDFNERI